MPAVIAVAILVSAILLIYVVPQFEDVFKGFGADLPAFTRMVVDLSRFVQDWWHVVLGVLILVVYGFIQLKQRSERFNQSLDRFVLKVPTIGPIIHKAAIARFARTLATMSAAGVPLVEAMESVAGATGNVVRDALFRGVLIRDDVEGASYGVGHFLLEALPADGETPKKTTPVFSGAVELRENDN